jgi:hypothetical protein
MIKKEFITLYVQQKSKILINTYGGEKEYIKENMSTINELYNAFNCCLVNKSITCHGYISGNVTTYKILGNDGLDLILTKNKSKIRYIKPFYIFEEEVLKFNNHKPVYTTN